MVTSLNLIDSKGKVDGERGVLSEKIGSADNRVGSWKAGASGGVGEECNGEGSRQIAGEG